MPVAHYPAWALCNALYLEGGIRGVEIGSVMFGKRQDDGTESYHRMELVRLAFPRRMYTQCHFDYAAEVIAELRHKAADIRGVRIVKQPPSCATSPANANGCELQRMPAHAAGSITLSATDVAGRLRTDASRVRTKPSKPRAPARELHSPALIRAHTALP